MVEGTPPSTLKGVEERAVKGDRARAHFITGATWWTAFARFQVQNFVENEIGTWVEMLQKREGMVDATGGHGHTNRYRSLYL